MKKSDVQIGQTYNMNHSSGRIQVRINQVIVRQSYGGSFREYREMTHWLGTNLKTGREIEIKSAVKLSPVNPARDEAITRALASHARNLNPVPESSLGLD